jgi:hypothetical protein
MHWTNSTFIDIDDLYVAYRKAKVDAFYERDHVTAQLFARFEENLPQNLELLLDRLNAEDPTWQIDLEIIGTYSYIPKSVEPPSDRPSLPSRPKGVQFVSSDADEKWLHECAVTPDADDIYAKAEFRLVGQHSAFFHVICALWIFKVGHKFDAALDNCARGSRLRRRGPQVGATIGAPHTLGLGSFRPYAFDFQSWRRDGLSAIRQSLKKGDPVVAVTADVRSFYHRASSDYLLNEQFQIDAGITLDSDEKEFTRQFTSAIAIWASKTPDHSDNMWQGLPVGISAPRVIANVSMWEFDRFVQRELSPIYYGRYVDDIFLVIRNDRHFTNSEQVWAFLIERSAGLLKEHHSAVPAGNEDFDIEVATQYSKHSDIKFGGKKLKVFSLAGESGEAMLNAIEHTLVSRSSEWRLLPDLPESADDLGLDLLTAGRDAAEEVDNLRKADGLTVRRLELAIRLRNLEAVQRDLDPRQWADHRHAFFALVRNHVLSVPGLFAYFSYVPRLFGLAAASMDWTEAKNCAKRLRAVWDLLELTAKPDPLKVRKCKQHLVDAILEAMAKAIGRRSCDAHLVGLRDTLHALQLIEQVISLDNLLELSRKLFVRDLAREPWREVLLDDVDDMSRMERVPLVTLTDSTLHKLQINAAFAFLEAVPVLRAELPGVPYPIAFPTRPLLPSEITLLDRRCIEELPRLRDAARGLRGVVLDIEEAAAVAPDQSVDRGVPQVVNVPIARGSQSPRVAIPCFLTLDSSWRASVAGELDPDARRYFRLNGIINDVLKTRPRPDYLVLPELCLPRRWFSRIAYKLAQSDVSLIAGVEYLHWSGTRKTPTPHFGTARAIAPYVSNQLRASLLTDSLGYRTFVVYEQEKATPALEEERELWSIGKKTLRSLRAPVKRVVSHGGFRFGLLICSELTDLTLRGQFRGAVDALFVLEWNRDIDTFSALIEASALDIHCFAIQSNNRLYGDCRVRAPYREAFRRDVARLKGGEDDYFVLAHLDIEALRAFQSRLRSPDGGEFKPVPDGFVLTGARKAIPR